MDEKEIELLHQKMNVIGNTVLHVMAILQASATPEQLSLIKEAGALFDKGLDEVRKEREAHGYKG